MVGPERQVHGTQENVPHQPSSAMDGPPGHQESNDPTSQFETRAFYAYVLLAVGWQWDDGSGFWRPEVCLCYFYDGQYDGQDYFQIAEAWQLRYPHYFLTYDHVPVGAPLLPPHWAHPHWH